MKERLHKLGWSVSHSISKGARWVRAHKFRVAVLAVMLTLVAPRPVKLPFLPKDDLVVYTDGRTEDSKMRLTATPENYLNRNGARDYLSKLPPVPGEEKVDRVIMDDTGEQTNADAPALNAPAVSP